MLPFKRILCPTDFSELSYRGLTRAVEVARHFSAELVVVHVVSPPPAAPVPGHPVYNPHPYLEELKQAAEQTLDDIVKNRISDDVRARHINSVGDPSEEIIRIADEEEADLIVLSTHGTSGIKRLIIGSVAEKIVRSASRPVLSIRAREHN